MNKSEELIKLIIAHDFKGYRSIIKNKSNSLTLKSLVDTALSKDLYKMLITSCEPLYNSDRDAIIIRESSNNIFSTLIREKGVFVDKFENLSKEEALRTYFDYLLYLNGNSAPDSGRK